MEFFCGKGLNSQLYIEFLAQPKMTTPCIERLQSQRRCYGQRYTGSIQRWCTYHYGSGTKVPHDDDVQSLAPLIPVFLSYALSFIYVGIYWNNHHHLLHATQNISGTVHWANLHLLFWLSLISFVTGRMGEPFAAMPVAFYSAVLLMAAISFSILQMAILKTDEAHSPLKLALGEM